MANAGPGVPSLT